MCRNFCGLLPPAGRVTAFGGEFGVATQDLSGAVSPCCHPPWSPVSTLDGCQGPCASGSATRHGRGGEGMD